MTKPTTAQPDRAALLDSQRRVLERIASGAPLHEILQTLVRLIEEQAHGLRCAVLLADASGQQLRFIAAPSIPEDYKTGIVPFLRIAPNLGSCGTAAWLREPVYTMDTATDERWQDCRCIALRNGLRAIWSTPILADDNRVLGTFAMCYGEPRLPSAEHVQLIDMATQMARVAIERKEAEDGLRRSAAELQALSRRLVELQESQHRQISLEMHDRVGQNLTALSINLGILRAAMKPQASRELRLRLDESLVLVEATALAIGDVMAELRPPMLDDHGLFRALDWHSRRFALRTGVAVAIRCERPDERLGAEAEIALFRIAQEALNNVLKHARASRVEIVLARSPGEFAMSVTDDGVGLGLSAEGAERPPGLGMVTMRERAQALGGSVDAQALPHGGTRLAVRVPLK